MNDSDYFIILGLSWMLLDVLQNFLAKLYIFQIDY